MIRRVLSFKLSDRITNADLYARCGIEPVSVQVVNARWRLFGHTLRMNEHTQLERRWRTISLMTIMVALVNVLL